MRQVDVKLGEWHRLYKELSSVEQLLAAQAQVDAARHEHEQLERRAARLRRECESAFQELRTALDARDAYQRQAVPRG